jgi:hypothetical protein
MTPYRWSRQKRRLAPIIPVFMVIGFITGEASAQPKTFQDLESRVAAGSAAGDLQIRVRWTTRDVVVDPASTANRFELVSIAATPAIPPPRRSRLTANSLVVVSEDGAGRELGWRVVADPRSVRAESQAGRPALTGETLYYQDVDLLVVIPHFADSARIRVFKPRWADGVVVLDAIGVVELH